MEDDKAGTCQAPAGFDSASLSLFQDGEGEIKLFFDKAESCQAPVGFDSVSLSFLG